MISFECPHCTKPLRVKDNLAGERVKCPACGKPASVPTPSLSPTPGGPAVPASGLLPREDRTLPPKSPTPSFPSEVPTIPPGAPASQPGPAANLSSETVSAGVMKNLAGHPSTFTDFLAPAQAPDEIGRLGPYRVLAILGHGGMGVVFRAEDPGLERQVALKAMLPALASNDANRARFLREAKAAAAIDHDNIVHIYQVGEDRGAPFIAMQFLEGEPLDARIKQGPKLSVAEIARIGRETALGLAAAHKRGLIHRDIKPGNLWLEGERARVKILDFGLARAISDSTHLTQSGAIIGTPAYMAPEQAGGRQVDYRCDLFSLGCVVYRLLTGEMAFKGNDTLAIISALALETPKSPGEINPDVPVELSDLVMWLLAKKPEDRPESAKVVAEALQQIEAEIGAIAAPSAPSVMKKRQQRTSNMGAVAAAHTQQAGRAKKRLPVGWLVGGGALCLAMLGLLAFLLLRPGGDRASRGNRDGSTAVKQPEALPATFTNSLDMEFVLVPKGKSWLGGGGGKPGDKEVEIKEDFYLGKYEVTQGEWEKVLGTRPSHFSPTNGIGKIKVKDITKADLERFPVDEVSWDDAQLFLKELNEREKEGGWVYRLPTEAEWEYACRGGPLTDEQDSGYDFYFDKPTNRLLPDQANFEHEKGLKRTCKVGSYKPNRLGLYDMHGNVSEWCDDLYKDAEGVSVRYYRGGSWNEVYPRCSAACRPMFMPARRDIDRGFRVARVPIKQDLAAPVPVEEMRPEKPVRTFTNSVGMEFVLVPKGKSWLGGGGGKPGDKEVEIKEDFYLGKYEVTQEEWGKLMGANPSHFSRTGNGKDAVKNIPDTELKRFPVEQVSFDDAHLFLRQLNTQARQTGWVYRLPKEGEWEYACRGGPLSDKMDSACDFYFDKPTNQLLPEQANFEHGKGLQRTCKVGSYKPNRLGLYDMHSNVWEWCLDTVKAADGKLIPFHRGGSWRDLSVFCAAAYRLGSTSTAGQSMGLGLRVARVPVGKAVANTPSPKPLEAKGNFVLRFDGSDSYVEVATLKNDGRRPVTLETWLYMESDKDANLVAWTGPVGIGLVTGWEKWGMARGADGLSTVFSADGNRRSREWVHLAAVWEKDNARLYVNGLRQKAAAFDFPDATAVDNNKGQLWIGGLPAIRSHFFAGLIAEMRISRSARYLANFQPERRFEPDAATLALYHLDDGAGSEARDASGNAHHGKIVGAKWVIADGSPIAPQNSGPPPTFTNSLGMDFVLVPKGKSWLGGGGGKPGDKEVEIKEDFYLGKYEVTQEEWGKVMGTMPSYYARDGAGKDKVKDVPDSDLKRFPVERVSWDDVQQFLGQLNKTNKEDGWVYRLPKMAQWEYACRGGPLNDKLDSAFDYFFERSQVQLQPGQANFDQGLKRTCRVGSYQPNRLGLFDMHGNVWEWCDDEQKSDKGVPLRRLEAAVGTTTPASARRDSAMRSHQRIVLTAWVCGWPEFASAPRLSLLDPLHVAATAVPDHQDRLFNQIVRTVHGYI